MPAQDSRQKKEAEVFYHIYNKVIAERKLFAERKDYQVFLDFLRDYISPPKDPESTRKTFTINGGVFKGVPHQPKNYFGKIELVAFSLMADHFHLLLHQKENGALEKLLRSISTRYAVFYNNKYKRTGSLFTGPYKSIQITKPDELVHLTLFLHQESLKAGNEAYSSYPEYKDERASSWINPKAVLSYFKGKNDYKNLMENYELKEEEKEMLKKNIIETAPEEFETSVLEPEGLSSKAGDSEFTSEPRVKIPAFMASSALMFLLLVGLGIRNVYSSAQTQKALVSLASPTTSPTPLASAEDISPTVLGEEDLEYETWVIISIDDGAESVNIRKLPSTESEILDKAGQGERFEFVSEEDAWFEIKFGEESAFVSKRYAKMEGESR